MVIFDKPTLCELCLKTECRYHTNPIRWQKGHTCGSFKGEDSPDDTDEYEAPDYSNVFPPGTWGKWVV